MVLLSPIGICFGLASRDYNFDGSDFHVLFYFQKTSVLSLGLAFRM